MKVAKVIRDYPIPGSVDLWFKAGDTLTDKIAREIFANEEDCAIEVSEAKRHPHFFEISEVPDGPWKPKAGEAYYALTTALDVFSDTMSGMGVDRLRIEAGNCFRTKEEAESKLPAVRAALTGKSLKEVLEGLRERLIDISDNPLLGPIRRAEYITGVILAVWESK